MSDLKSIRTTFLGFFQKNGHKILPSSSLIPHNDPTLMFTNSGMVQFKNIFTGQEKPMYKMATTVQKCVRAGGKHNDLENVGRTTRHHTFFEMLGNFSFGDYFKEKAIQLAWELLTKEFNIDQRRLYITVYNEDEDAFKLWKKISGLSSDKIIPITTNDNFWSMADTGPCGPCSEIFFDQGDCVPGGLPGSSEEGDRYLEIWNLVFMQFEQKNNKERCTLPSMSVDTGMGLERMSAVLQGKIDNYDIDLFKNLINASEQVTGVKYEGDNIVNHRVIVDHLRSSSFLIADGILPSNEGRGYVLRRIMRRAMCYARLLGYMEPLMVHLFTVLCSEMGSAYPELIQAQSLIEETMRLEDRRFSKTLNRGLTLLDEVSYNLGKNEILDGSVAFKLYDTHGLPLDIMQDILWVRGLGGVDMLSFNQALEEQRSKARAHSLGLGAGITEKLWFSLKEKCGATQFVGYDLLRGSKLMRENEKISELSCQKLLIDLTQGFPSIVKAIVQQDKIVKEVFEGQEAEIIFEQTPFYAESGGQIGDTGFVVGEGVRLQITDVQKKAEGIFVHYARVESGILRTDMPVVLTIDYQKRRQISINHSATHLLHHALCTVLGSHVSQSGSCITPEGLRFDITHSEPITSAEIRSIEDNVNDVIAQNLPIITRIMNIDDAIASGASSLLGKKYSNQVRVVSVEYGNGKLHSSALCGGTHVSSTGEIMLFHIVSESSIRAGVRRIEVITGQRARSHLIAQDEKVRLLSSFLKVSQNNVIGRVEEIWEERRKLQQINAKRKLQVNIEDLSCHNIMDVNFMSHVVSDMESKELKGLVDILQKKIKSGIIMIVGISKEQKASVVIAVTKDLLDRFDAVVLARLSAKVLGGSGGGGRPHMAQSGGPDGSKVDQAIASVVSFLKK
ncbi:alanine--tRNA ligase [Candidatus Liberibacter africanus]|uniref:Alanine--tRNA ligase n=1 Tax=Candidatus Liberibacter africanus PTSAPSY TaxID=1277257 RepID=A0A0G3I9J2_LIBAF|nr:alanine--tRNA ligase [Candidatus Liberibacter africanus]AKK20437.1 alanyl-tRNA synthetase [Candidatus Liberibacter africanus PTSAPSY]